MALTSLAAHAIVRTPSTAMIGMARVHLVMTQSTFGARPESRQRKKGDHRRAMSDSKKVGHDATNRGRRDQKCCPANTVPLANVFTF